MRQTIILGFSLVALAGGAAQAGPCASGIYEAQTDFDALLARAAQKGPSGVVTVQARLHRQTTPQSLAEAEAKLGDISAERSQTFVAAMSRARSADSAGDAKGCRAALKDAQAELKP